jgi:hypothetical protein
MFSPPKAQPITAQPSLKKSDSITESITSLSLKQIQRRATVSHPKKIKVNVPDIRTSKKNKESFVNLNLWSPEPM